MFNTEQTLDSLKANLNTAMGLGNTVFKNLEKVAQLNIHTAKTAWEETLNHAQAVLGAKDAQEATALNTSFLQPCAEKVAHYHRQLHSIVTDVGTEFQKTAEEKVSETQKAMGAFVEKATSSAAGTAAKKR